MNERIKELSEEADKFADDYLQTPGEFHPDYGAVRDQMFAELIIQAIYDEVKEELMADEMINIEPDSLSREYLKGCNGGIVDALYHIKNFGVDVDE